MSYIADMKAYLFDLDGTLTDSRAGLYPAFRSGLKSIGVHDVRDDRLATFLGTSLPEIFRTMRPDVTQSEIAAGIDAFRATYDVTGIVANALYPGVLKMLEGIRTRGATTWVVTSKPEFQAVRVVKHLDLDPYVAGVIGAGTAELDTKAELVARALAAAHVGSDEAVMVGDRSYDIIGALANNVQAVGVLWGYGSQQELESAGCTHLVHSADEFRERFVESDIGFSDEARPSIAMR